MGKKILIIDDDPHWTEILSARLRAEGYVPLTASDGDEGIGALSAGRPDLVICDVMMPKMSGYDFVRRFQEHAAQVRSIPVIIVSSRESMGDFFDSWTIHRFLSKSAEPAILMGEIENLLGGQEAPAPPSAADRGAAWPGKTVMIVGVDDYVVRKIKHALEERKVRVVLGIDENDAFETAVRERPDYVFCQFFEDTDTLDAQALFERFRRDERTRELPVVIFCSEGLGMDAMKITGAKSLIVYRTGNELVQNIESFLRGQGLSGA